MTCNKASPKVQPMPVLGLVITRALVIGFSTNKGPV